MQQDSGEERVTAKSRPMMSLIARAPSTLSSSASESAEKKAMEIRVPGVRKLRKMIDRGNPLFALKEEQCHSNSSLETTKQNWNCR